MPKQRELDIVVWGATGYTGRLVADYLATSASAADIRWGIGGRNRDKLARVRDELAAHRSELSELPILVGDANDATSLAPIAESTRVVCTTVGPYAKYGGPMVAACVEAGTSYCDLTGEVHWMRRMIDAHHDRARERGARIVHTCGFDSIPSDLGVLMMHEAMKARGASLARVDSLVKTKGGPSGGTVASMLAILDEASRDRDTRRVLGDPYALDPEPRLGGPDGSDPKGISYEPRLERWTAPFVMSSINTRVVRRSNALSDYAYGRDFRYTERASLPGNLKGLMSAATMTAGLGALVAAAQVPWLRKLIEKRAPQPGEGPSPEQRKAGFFEASLIAEARQSSIRLLGTVSHDRDPGYGSTSVMLGEAALCLARDLPDDAPTGILTPATAMGMTLVDRLRRAGMTWEVTELH